MGQQEAETHVDLNVSMSVPFYITSQPIMLLTYRIFLYICVRYLKCSKCVIAISIQCLPAFLKIRKSPDGFGRREDQAENSGSHPQREVSDLLHPLHPQHFRHRRAGLLLLQHLRGHCLLPGGSEEQHKGNDTTSCLLLPPLSLLNSFT